MLQKLFTLTVIFLLGLSVKAQEHDHFDNIIQKNGCLSFGKIKKDQFIKQNSANEQLLISSVINKKGKVEIKRVLREVFGDGSEISKYQLYYKNAVLRGAEYAVFSGGGYIKCVYGFFADVSDKNPDKSEAAKRRSILAARAYFEKQHQTSLGKGKPDIKTADAIFVYYFNNKSLQFEPVWQVRIESPGAAIAENLFINPVSGVSVGRRRLG